MGQQISLSDFTVPDLFTTGTKNSSETPTEDQIENTHLFLPPKFIDEINKNSIALHNQKSTSELSVIKARLIQQIRFDISEYTKSGIDNVNTEMMKIIQKTSDYVETVNTRLQNSMQMITKQQKELRNSYREKLKDIENETTPILTETFSDLETLSTEQQAKELSCFGVQSLILMLLMLLKSVHQSNPFVVHQMLTLTNQIVEQIPLKYLSLDVYKRSDNLFKSLKPLLDYIKELSTQSDVNPIAAKKATNTLFNISIVTSSFRDILPLIRKLIFNTDDTVDTRKILVRINKHLEMSMEQLEKEKQTTTSPTEENAESKSKAKTGMKLSTEEILEIENIFTSAVEYLTTIEAFPNAKLMALEEKRFTGQFVCLALLVHIDLHNQLDAKSQLETNSLKSSFSFELESDTFQHLYEIIEGLVILEPTSHLNLEYGLNTCLRLFTTHLTFLIATDLDNFHSFLSKDDIEKWFILLSKLAFDSKSEERKREASKALSYLIEKHASSFDTMMTFIHKHIFESQHPILIDQLLSKLNQPIFIYKWIENLISDQYQPDNSLPNTVLHSFIDIAIKPSSLNIENVNRLRDIISLFQDLLLVYIKNQSTEVSDELESSALATLGVKYITHVIKASLECESPNALFEPLLLGLCTLVKWKVNFAVTQPIFAVIMPLFANYLAQTKIKVENKMTCLMSWLLGEMINHFIIGPPESPLEEKYDTILKLPLFSGGYETLTNDTNMYLSSLFKSDFANYSRFHVPLRRQQSIIDNDFLLSVYYNTGRGAQLIEKMKLYVRDKHYPLQTSIESIASDACAAVFAVYIKHYRRVELAQNELFQPMEQRPPAKLLSLYQYANEVRMIIATAKAGGGDYVELSQQIRKDALLLLVSIRESSFIPIVKENLSIPTTPSKTCKFQRQESHWTKARSIIRLLRNAFNACIKLKYLMLEKKRAVEQRTDCESVMHRAIRTCLYTNDRLTTAGNQKIKIQSDEIVKCLIRQYQRAMTRLLAYRFIEQLVTTSDNENRVMYILFISLKASNLNWHYLMNIQASNSQLKEEIGQLYYKIVKSVFTFSMESSDMKVLLMQRVFDMLNLDYDSMDLCHINKYQLVPVLFNSFASLREIDTSNVDLINLKITAFNWFRIVVLKLCENIELEKLRNVYVGNQKFHQVLQKDCALVFNELILNELNQLQQKIHINEEDRELSSLKNVVLRSLIASSKFDVEISINQYLMLLLRCIHLYDHIRLNCATIDYTEQLHNLYQTSQSLSNRLLILRILRDLLVYLPDNTHRATNRLFIENLLKKILFSVGQYFNLLEAKKTDTAIIIEFIYIYRTIMSAHSPWKKLAIMLLVDAIKLSMNFSLSSLESVEPQQMNSFLASLCILGGYIRPFCLGSTVEVYSDDLTIEGNQTATIVEVNPGALEPNTESSEPYLVQYSFTNKVEWISSNELHVIADVPIPTTSLLSIDNGVHIHTILDALGYLATIDASTINSLTLLEIQHRALTALYEILDSKSIIEIFITKSYAPIIAELSTSMKHLNSTHCSIPNDLRMFNRLHLEHYYLSLDRYARKNHLPEYKFDMLHNKNGWNRTNIIRDATNLQYLSEKSVLYENWRPIATKCEIDSYKNGRLGTSDIRIVSVPLDDSLPPLEECGIKHKFYGRVNITDEDGDIQYPTFVLDDIELYEGKWYFCVKLPLGGTTQIGWATKGFKTVPSNGYGVGDDDNSWGYDGYRNVCYHNQKTSFRSDVTWDAEDVCGCGIEINGTNTNIKYWLNGKFLGTAFSHNENNKIESVVKTNLLPRGAFPAYFPGVTVRVYRNIAHTGVFEYIFSPEDMTKCPLPKGYKPLLTPKLLTLQNTLVAYPHSAYLIGNEHSEYIYHSRCSDNNVIRDFVNDHHLEVPFTCNIMTENDYLLKLSGESDGFPLTLDNQSSLTISFDFELLTANETEILPETLDIALFMLEQQTFSMRIYLNDINDDFIDERFKFRQRVAILFRKNEQTKVYINNNLHILNYCHSYDPKQNSKLSLQLLPHLNVGIRNIGVWRYTLSEEYIRRLFTYGIAHVAVDYLTLKEHRKQKNTIRFKPEQTYFTDQILLPFNRPFDEDAWANRKQLLDQVESISFKTNSNNQHAVVQLFGNKTYLVLDMAEQVWSEYTLILDVSIPNYPSTNNHQEKEARLTLISLNSESEIYLTHEGHLCVSGGQKSSTTMPTGNFIRLCISIESQSIHVYINGSLELNATVKEDQFAMKSKRIELFRELDLTKNIITDDELRIECQSITYLNQSTHTLSPRTQNLLQSSDQPLDELTTLPFSVLSTSLIGIGYAEEAIKYAIKQYETTNIYFIDSVLREGSQVFEESIQQLKQQTKNKLLGRLNQYDTTKALGMFSGVESHANEYESWRPNENAESDSTEKEWYIKTVRSVGIQDKLDDWVREKAKNRELENDTGPFKLLNLTKPNDTTTERENSNKKAMSSWDYTHQQLSQKDYMYSRITCNYGLIAINARYIILNMLKVWYDNIQISSFPFSVFGNTNFIIDLLKLMDHYREYTSNCTDEIMNSKNSLISTMLKVELRELLKYVQHEDFTDDIVKRKAPLFYELQRYAFNELINCLAEPELINAYIHNDENIDERQYIKQVNLSFLLQVFYFFLDVIKEFQAKHHDLNKIVSLLFSDVVVKMLFDLFLWVSSHEIRISILCIFTRLVQAIEHFKLHDDIRSFTQNLFIELLGNEQYRDSLALKYLRRAAMQLELIQLEKQKRLVSSLNESSLFMKSLVISLDLIGILKDKIETNQWPEMCVTYSKEALGDNLLLTEEMITTAHPYFNKITDEQLMKVLNQTFPIKKKALALESVIKCIESIPAEPTPDPAKYASFTHLCDIPSVYIQTRVKYLLLLNIALEKLLPKIDFNVSASQSIIIYRMQLVRNYILLAVKSETMNEALSKTASDSSQANVKFDIMKATVAECSEDTMFYQAYKQLYADASDLFRQQGNENIWKAVYVGMHSDDQGGPYRDSITRICTDLCSNRLSLFILCPNGRMNNGQNRDRWIPNVFPPNQPIPTNMKNQYRFVGQLMGMAIRRKHYLDIRFPTLLWKQLVDEEVTIEDIEAIDISSFTIIKEMEENIQRMKHLNECDKDNVNCNSDHLFSSIMTELTFDVVSSNGQTYELVPGGFDIPITASNFEDYCKYYRAYRINEFHRQIEFIRQGLFSVVPYGYFNLFTAREIEELVCGKGYIDIALLKRHTNYHKDNESSPRIQRFWSVLSEMFTEEQKKLFLIFVWGRSTLPAQDEDFSASFTITLLETTGNVDQALPKSFTCNFTLQLPDYSTREIMYERLNYAISYCSAIDNDRRMN